MRRTVPTFVLTLVLLFSSVKNIYASGVFDIGRIYSLFYKVNILANFDLPNHLSFTTTDNGEFSDPLLPSVLSSEISVEPTLLSENDHENTSATAVSPAASLKIKPISPTPKEVVTELVQTITVTLSPTPPLTADTTSISDQILAQINSYRLANAKNAITKDNESCSFAELRAKEILVNFDHSGFSSRMDSKTLPFPSFTKAVENIAMNSDFNGVFDQWKNSSGHSENMLSDILFGCVGVYGKYYAFVGYRP